MANLVQWNYWFEDSVKTEWLIDGNETAGELGGNQEGCMWVSYVNNLVGLIYYYGET